MFKVGDKVKCKSFPKIVNHIERDNDPNITVDKYYEIIQIDTREQNLPNNLRMLRIMGEQGPCWYWSHYFYNKTELRKQKIEKICSKLEI